MSTTISGKIPLAQAHDLALELVEIFKPVCDRIEIAGSIRREKPEVGDIEIVMVPKFEDQEDPNDLFGKTISVNLQTDKLLDLIVSETLLHRRDVNDRPSCGERYQRMIYKGVATDLFCVLAPASWGVLFAIRTGPAVFNKRIVTQRSKGGILPDDMKIQDGQLWIGDQPVETPEERDLFQMMNMPTLAPRDRK